MKYTSAVLWMITAFFAVNAPAIVEAGRSLPPASSPAPQNALTQAVARLNTYAALQKALQVETSELPYAMKKALTAADQLIKADVTLDLGSVSAVKAAFVPTSPLEWEANMGKVLDQLDTTWLFYRC